MRQLVFFFILSCLPAFSQVHVTENDIQLNLSHLDNLGKELVILKKDSTLLAPNSYSSNYTKRGKSQTVSFVINDAGKPDGIVAVDRKLKAFVRNGTIYRYESYHTESYQLAVESFMRGDTIIWKMYNKHNQLRAENWTIKAKTVYAFECDCDYETDTIQTCTLNDDVKGQYIQYGKGGKMISRKITENLPKDVVRQLEDYDEKGKLLSTEIYYESGKIKTTYANGEYSITTPKTEGDYIEKYTKKGKLLEHYMRPYPTSN